jgi:hypothetical protein
MESFQGKPRIVSRSGIAKGNGQEIPQINTVGEGDYIISHTVLNAILKTYENLDIPYKMLYGAIEQLKNLPRAEIIEAEKPIHEKLKGGLSEQETNSKESI